MFKQLDNFVIFKQQVLSFDRKPVKPDNNNIKHHTTLQETVRNLITPHDSMTKHYKAMYNNIKAYTFHRLYMFLHGFHKAITRRSCV